MKFRAILAACLLSAAALSGSADAAVYTARWDPTAYGAPFPNLGWRGTAEYFVPDSCVPTGTAVINNATACLATAVVNNAEVKFYDIGASGPTLETLVFDETSFVIGTLRYVSGELTQLTTNFSNVVDPTSDLSAFGVSSTTGFFLQFTLDGPRLGWIDCTGGTTCQTGFNDSVHFPVQFTITRVPEPTTLALLGVGLAGLAASRRRKQ